MYSRIFFQSIKENWLADMMKVERVNSLLEISYLKLVLNSISISVMTTCFNSMLRCSTTIFERPEHFWKLFNPEKASKIEEITLRLSGGRAKMSFRSLKVEGQHLNRYLLRETKKPKWNSLRIIFRSIREMKVSYRSASRFQLLLSTETLSVTKQLDQLTILESYSLLQENKSGYLITTLTSCCLGYPDNNPNDIHSDNTFEIT